MKLSTQDIQKSQQAQLNKKYGFFLKQGDSYLNIVVELPSVFTVEDALKYVLQQFYKEQGISFNGVDHQLKIAKKNGEPKSDMPSLDPEQLLVETGCILFTVIQTAQKKSPKHNGSAATTCEDSLQQSSIRTRISYTNSLNTSKKQIIKEKKQEKSNGGFCFLKQCF